MHPRTEAAPRTRPGAAELLRPRPVAVILALLALVLGGGIGAAVARSADSSWASITVLTIDQPLVVAAANDPGPIEKLNRLRLQYAALLRTAVVAEDVADRSGVPAGEVAAKVTAEPALNSLLIVITARDPDPGTARRLATASAEALIAYSDDAQAQARIAEDQQVQLTVVTPAGEPQEERQGRRTVATVALFLGLVSAAAVYVVVSLLTGAARRR